MKSKMLFLAFMLVGIFTLSSCSETGSDEFCNDPGIDCGAAVIESCCTDTECYWIYNGTKYTCSGTNCTEVTETIAGKCTAALAGVEITDTDVVLMKAKLDALTQELLVQARAASGCNL